MTYGPGDGATTFNIPDLRGRSAFGKDDMGGHAAGRVTGASGVNGLSLGASGGEEMHTLSISEMPAHDHGGGNHNHNIQNFPASNTTRAANPTVGGAADSPRSTVTTDYSGNVIAAQGGNTPHNIMPPSLVLNYIIKY